MTDSPFSSTSLEKAVDEAMAKPGSSVDVGLEVVPGERPAVVVEAQGGGERVSWGAYLRSQFSKASTAVGAKIGWKF